MKRENEHSRISTIKFKTRIIRSRNKKIFGLGIKWYAIIIVFCIIMALVWCKFRSEKYNIDFDEILSLFIILIPTVIICARLYYVLCNLNYYLSNTIQIINIRGGGLAIYGGIIGGIIACYIF